MKILNDIACNFNLDSIRFNFKFDSTPVAMIEWYTQNLEAFEKSLALHLHGEVYDFVA
jgi:hypothetical protein